jgi:hypothetical protein
MTRLSRRVSAPDMVCNVKPGRIRLHDHTPFRHLRVAPRRRRGRCLPRRSRRTRATAPSSSPSPRGSPGRRSGARSSVTSPPSADLRLSVHAPYFAGLTLPDEDRALNLVRAIEHTMKLGKALGASVIVAHFGSNYDEDPAVLMDRIRSRIDLIAPKVETLGRRPRPGDRRQSQPVREPRRHRPARRRVPIRPSGGRLGSHPRHDRGGPHLEGGIPLGAPSSKESFPGMDDHPSPGPSSPTTSSVDVRRDQTRRIRGGDPAGRPLIEAVESAGMSMVFISESRDRRATEDLGRCEGADVCDSPPRVTAADSPLRGGRRLPSPCRGHSGWRPVRPAWPGPADHPVEHRQEVLPRRHHQGRPHPVLRIGRRRAPSAPVGRPISMSRYPEGIDGPRSTRSGRRAISPTG